GAGSRQGLGVLAVVDGIGFRDSKYASILNVVRSQQPDLFKLAPAQGNQFVIRRVPQRVPFVTEVFEPEGRLVGIWNHVRAPVLEILNATDSNLGIVDVNPVVGENVWLVDDQTNCQKIPIFQSIGGIQYFGRRGRIEFLEESGNGHCRDNVLRLQPFN